MIKVEFECLWVEGICFLRKQKFKLAFSSVNIV